jgi:ribosomal protein S12 methylthiotransferase
MKLFFDALGCPKALVDAERMCYFLEKGNHTLTGDPEEADAVIVNTCGFTYSAKEENIGVILNYAKMKKRKPSLKLIVTGCLTERYTTQLLKSIPEIDNAIGIRDQSKVLEALEGPHIGKKLLDSGKFNDTGYVTERSLVFSGYRFAYLKISEGCGRSCAFCSIPSIRGKQRSRPMEDIVREAEFLLKNGAEELILVSEDTVSYGLDLYKGKKLIELLEKLSKLDFRWIRVMYLYPEETVYQVAEFIRDHKNFCRYLDIPLQHASGKILKSMKRKGDADTYLKMIARLRETVPGVRIRSSFIVGFPGETAADQKALRDFLTAAQLDRVGFFEYSREEGTPGYSMKKQVGKKTVRARLTELAIIQKKISAKRLKTLAGKKLLCVFDGTIKKIGKTEYAVFRSEYDAPEIDGAVYVPYNSKEGGLDGFCGIIVDKVKGAHDLTGRIAPGPDGYDR